MAIDTPICIVDSEELSEMRLSELVGRTGVTLNDLTQPERKFKGYMVLLDKPFMKAWIWFIPENSVCYED